MFSLRFQIGRRQMAALAAAACLFTSVANQHAVAADMAASKNARLNDIYIVAGASGQLGELVVKELLARGVPAKNLILVSRTPEKLAEYKKMGASTRFGDVDRPESLADAYKGGTRMMMISLGAGPGTPPRPPRHKLAFDAAAKAGVKQIAYTSYHGAGEENVSGLALDHQQSENFLRASGVAWTSLRNAFYMDMQLQGALQMASTGKASARTGEAKSTPVTRQDCAAAAVGVLLYPGHENKAYEITGPGLIDTSDVAKAVEAITGKKVEVTTAAANAGGPPGGGAPGVPGGAGPGGGAPRAGGAPGGGAMMAPAMPAVVTTAVADITGRPATSLRTFLEANKAQLMAAAAKR
jgi:NAD(P)H dehydrogenase (quinone)